MRMQRLTGYLLAVSAIGLAVLGFVVQLPGAFDVASRPWVIAPLALVIIIGELRPISIARGEAQADEVSISSTMGVALLLLAPLGVVLVVQTLALLVYELRPTRQRNQQLLRLTFNVAQYTLAFVAARLVYVGLSGRPFVMIHPHIEPHNIPMAWAAALAFYLVNSGLTSVAFALATGSRLPSQFRRDLRWQLASSSMLLGLAPVVAQAELWSPYLLPVLLFPIVVVHSSAALAAKREFEALHDSLTGLPNRSLLLAHLSRSLETRPEGTSVGLLLLDLDHFKEINDTLGHAVGDRLICEVAQRINGVLSPVDLVARLGGDEFAVVATGPDKSRSATDVALLLSSALEQPFVAEGVMLDISWSVGIAVAPEHADSTDMLLQRADVALYAAKETRGAVALYDPERDQNSLQRLTLALDLRRALEQRQLEVYYQPQVDAATLDPIGMEALIRWQHPTLGWIDPETVVALAASTGLLASLTDHVLHAALVAVGRWRAMGYELNVAVNLMPRQLADNGLPGLIATLLEEYDVPADALILEVTEGTVMTDAVSTQSVLRALRAMGVGLSIDDFGTGYSSLAQLQRLAPDEIKVDRIFVSAMQDGNSDRVIVRSTIDLGRSLGLRVVAEGVDTESTAAELAALGCDVLQGFAIGRPQTEDRITRWLAARAPARRHLATVVPLRESV